MFNELEENLQNISIHFIHTLGPLHTYYVKNNVHATFQVREM